MKILIADRSSRIRERIIELAIDAYKNPEIFETSSYLEAIKEIKSHKPNIIITDIDLENGSGLNLLRFMRNQDSKSLKIVFTNQLKYNFKEISKQLGADHFFFKGHDIVKIKNILNSTTSNAFHNLSSTNLSI